MWLDYFLKALLDKYPIYMTIITLSGIAVIINIIRVAVNDKIKRDLKLVLASGLVALIVSLSIYPIESILLVRELSNAENVAVSIVPGGFYIGLVPILYGIFWFLISLMGWIFFKKRSAQVGLTEGP